MTDVLRIAHPQDCPLEGNPEVGNPEIHLNTDTRGRKICQGYTRNMPWKILDFLKIISTQDPRQALDKPAPLIIRYVI